jgi:DNA repair protein RadC
MSSNPLSSYFGQQLLLEPFKFLAQPHEYKIVALRECPTPEDMQFGDTPQKIADYWKLHVAMHPHYDPERECLCVFLLNVRRRIKGHQLVSTGTNESVNVSATSVFRLAITTSASAIVMAHNHPSGETSPSAADIRITRELIKAGQLLRIEVLDHIIMAHPNHASMKEMGLFYD